MTPENIERLLRLTGFDYTECLWWRGIGDEPLTFYVPCNDLFMWGCADVEEITDDNIDSLIDIVNECEEIMGRWRGEDGFLVWCAVQRGMRPQGVYYKHFDEKLHHLFDAAGPEREVDMFNPKERA